MSAMSFAIANSMRASREREYQNYLYKLKKRDEEKKKKSTRGVFICKQRVSKNMIEVFEPRDDENIDVKKIDKTPKKRCCI